MITKLIRLKGPDPFPCKYQSDNKEWNLEDLEKDDADVYAI